MMTTFTYVCRNVFSLIQGVIVLVFCPADLFGQLDPSQSTQAELKQLSLEQLLEVNITSVSRRPESLHDSPSSIQVITQEEIRRSGARSIPEALRLASNLQVAQRNAREWAITSRGFNGSGGTANKLLVMIDGRTVYTPLFSGVFWDVQDYLMEDIDRIEVISGPGAASGAPTRLTESLIF